MVRRLGQARLPKQVLEWTPSERRKQGRSHQRGCKVFQKQWQQEIYLKTKIQWTIKTVGFCKSPKNYFEFPICLSNRNYQVRANGSLSSSKNQLNCTQQGSVISPTPVFMSMKNILKPLQKPVHARHSANGIIGYSITLNNVLY